MRVRGRGMSRKDVEDAHGRDCVGAMPSGRPAERLPTPWGTEILVLRDPDRTAIERLAGRDAHAGVRFWLSPCGGHAVAWTAGDVAHFQLFTGLMDRGWHQGRIEPYREGGPVLSCQDHVAGLLIDGGAGARMAGGPFVVRTNLRTVASGDVPDDGASPAPAP